MQSELDRVNNADGVENDDVKKTTSRVEFRQIARNMERYEVCRMFLATLSLVNGGNIAIDDTEECLNSLSVQLLKSDIDRPMETYLAPSVAAGACNTADDEMET